MDRRSLPRVKSPVLTVVRSLPLFPQSNPKSNALILARGGADTGGCGAITAPKRMIEIGQVAEAGLEGDGADHAAAKTRIDQATMHARQPLVQYEVGEGGVIALE